MRNSIFWLALLLYVGAASAQSTTPWLTRSGDNQRTGWNANETRLSQATVNAKGISLKTTIPVYGDARGLEAQPLIVPNVPTGRMCIGTSSSDLHCEPTGMQDVMILCSMANQCRGVNAETGADIWDVSLGMPINGAIPFNAQGNTVDGYQINNFWGATSTGVVDPNDNRFYQVFWMSPDGSGSPATARYYMAVLNVADGSQVVPPVQITGTSQGYDFNQTMRKARSSAVLLNQNGTRTVLQCTGTVLETTQGAAGFCFAFDTYLNKVVAMLATTAGEGAGIWQAGQGLSCDKTSTYCYAITGNGDYDGKTQWGESFIQISYTPPTAKNPNGAKITINKGYSPWTDFQRSGQAQVPAGKVAGVSLPSEAVRAVGSGMSSPMASAKLVAKISKETGAPLTLVYPAMASGAEADEDFGSAGPACIFAIGYCVAAGKDGEGFSIPVPGFTGTTSTTVGTVANCQYAQPAWLTASPGDLSPCPTDPHTLGFFINGDTAHLHMTPPQYFDPLLNSWTIFVGGENQQLHKWKVSSMGALTWVANAHEYASANVRDTPPGGMSGEHCAGSSNGSDPNSAIVVCVVPYSDQNKTISYGHIVIYDAVHLGADGYLKTLWDSANWSWSMTANKFLDPIIDNGQIYVPNYSGGVMVLGLSQ